MAAHMITATGRDHYLSGPDVHTNVIALDDIAHALAQINRYTGHAKRPYSVAEHSLLVADLIAADGHSPIVQLAGLMHDAHEAYCGDAATPVKQAVGLAWSTFEALQADQVRRSFQLTSTFAAHRDLIRRYDLIALATERAQLMHYRPGHNQWWMVLDSPGATVLPAEGIDLNEARRFISPWTDWRLAFTSRYLELAHQIWPNDRIPNTNLRSPA